ncbi:MAG: hypothetical protein AAF467_05265 [Actinomycetota bacterium]
MLNLTHITSSQIVSPLRAAVSGHVGLAISAAGASIDGFMASMFAGTTDTGRTRFATITWCAAGQPNVRNAYVLPTTKFGHESHSQLWRFET